MSEATAALLASAARRVQLPAYGRDMWEPHRHLAWYGGRGGAKSRTCAAGAVLMAAQGHERVLNTREVQRSIRDSSKRLIDDTIDRMGLRPLFISTDTEIRGPWDSLFMFHGLRGNASTVRSLEGITLAWNEESNRVSQASIETLIPTIRAPGSRLWWTWNPDQPTDPVDRLFRDPAGPPPGTILRTVNWHHNPWFPEELRREMEWDKRRDPDKYAHIWLGEYRRNSEARVFKNWRIEAFETPADVRFYYGADWGFAVDPTTLVRMWLDGRTLYVDAEAYAIGCEIDATPALFDTVAGARHWPIRADSARPETISYMRRQGFNVKAATKGPGSVEDGVTWLQSLDIVVHPRCRHVIDELTLYSWAQDPLNGDILPKLLDANNHCIDAMRYATEDLRRGGLKPSISAGRRDMLPPPVQQYGTGRGFGSVPMPRDNI